MKIYKKIINILGLMSIGAITLAACGSNNSNNQARIEALTKAVQEDSTAITELKTRLAGYSTDDMEIIANKQEIAEQSRDFIKVFNDTFGTKLAFTQVGGATDYGQFLSTKLVNGVGNVLMIGGGSVDGFAQTISRFTSASAAEMLHNDDTTAGQFLVNGKAFLPAAVESIGVIYNRDTFAKAKITVFEGQSFENATTKPADLVKPTTDYNGTIVKDGNTYVFTSDLTEPGYRLITKTLTDAKIDPFYVTSKTQREQIWPMTNHLLGAAVNAQTGLTANDEVKLRSEPNAILTNEVINSMKTALDIYGHDAAWNLRTNTVDNAMNFVALGRYAMSQNGTWATPQITRANPDANVGFLPMPIFNKTDKTAMLYRSVSQRWGLTTLAEDAAKKKTAQLFLQFLYQTKSGLEYAGNEMQLYSPFKAVPGVNLDFKDNLSASSQRYQGADLGETVDNYFVTGFGNTDEVVIQVTNEGYKMADSQSRLITEFNRLIEARKNTTATTK
ncbi:raffinose/stachyose/melibiose transport system substrate-binding protein [Mycoplasmoides fastidiosum]|uniref:Raffinose/stachyose/melibiose transport system substrate-binding protein n=1 Tax=Mycoplasmoides fastidiosum TaxID=92758 RepID=A0ABU0LYU3_9BACT|nr:extracellular solute-binding protein [Mycoplasmoides fastidiosum]MDQ0513842.1 raffinose/stachyose/melibiose transport system substrate-binding protein [Mycoplasmoides fastidiosum]UUD37743.1 extracellular solute-binding protein [Mycoplasmoides fastidiosum]